MGEREEEKKEEWDRRKDKDGKGKAEEGGGAFFFQSSSLNLSSSSFEKARLLLVFAGKVFSLSVCSPLDIPLANPSISCDRHLSQNRPHKSHQLISETAFKRALSQNPPGEAPSGITTWWPHFKRGRWGGPGFTEPGNGPRKDSRSAGSVVDLTTLEQAGLFVPQRRAEP